MSMMRFKAILASFFAVIFLVACEQTSPEGEWTVSESVSVAASPDEVWEVIGDYYDVHSWHPGINSTQKSGAKDAEIRILILEGGGLIYEELLSHSDADRMYSYKILEAPLPVVDYTAQLSVEPEGGGSKATWSARFGVDGDEAEIQNVVRGVFSGGLQAVAGSFGG